MKSRTSLRENNSYYLAAINPVRFAEIWDECNPYIKKKGDLVILYNEETKEHVMMRWDPIGEKKQYVLTNVFSNRKKVGNSPRINSISETYNTLVQ